MAWRDNRKDRVVGGIADSIDAAEDVWVSAYRRNITRSSHVRIGIDHNQVRGLTPNEARELAALLIEAAAIAEQEDAS